MTWDGFYKEIDANPYTHNVKDWTAKGVAKAKDLYSTGVKNCSFYGVVEDETDAVATHICPSYKENEDFSVIEGALDSNIDKKCEGLQAFLFGSDSFFEKSKGLFRNFQRYSTQRKIPCTTIRGCKVGGLDSAVAYHAQDKTWLVTNDSISEFLETKKPKDPKKIKNFLETIFEEVSISKNDQLVV